MHNPVLRFLWSIAWHLCEWRQLQLASEALLVELHRFPAVSIKVQVSDDLFHDLLQCNQANDLMFWSETGASFLVTNKIREPTSQGTSEPAIVPMNRCAAT